MKNQKNRGITLIALVITIIILLILAGVTIATLTGENGILNKANKAGSENEKQTAAEKINLKITTAQIETYTEKQRMPSLKEVSLKLGSDDEIAYVTEASKVASTEYDVPSENPSAIYTKLKEYPYEFEIDDKLRLAAVDGMKIADSSNDDLTSKIEDLETEINSLKTKNMMLQKEKLTKENQTITEISLTTSQVWNEFATIELTKSIEEYKYIEFQIDGTAQKNESTTTYAPIHTILIPVDSIKYMNFNTFKEHEEGQIALRFFWNDSYAQITGWFENNKTFKVGQEQTNNAMYKKLRIKSINGIK